MDLSWQMPEILKIVEDKDTQSYHITAFALSADQKCKLNLI